MTDNVAYLPPVLPPVPPAPEAPAPDAPKVEPVAPHPLAEQLARCRPFLEEGLTDGVTWEEVSADVMAGRAQLWPGDKAAMVTQLSDESTGRVLHVWVGGGELDELLKLEPAVAAWGRSVGCNRASIASRPAWGKVLKSSGWAASFVMYSRPL